MKKKNLVLDDAAKAAEDAKNAAIEQIGRASCRERV